MACKPTHILTQIPLANLTPEHFSALDRALANTLSTALAFETLAQIVDGFPTQDVYQDYDGPYRVLFGRGVEPSQEARQVIQRDSKKLLHADLASECSGSCQLSMELLRVFRPLKTWEGNGQQVAQMYQNTLIGSRNFSLRLMEIVAVLCHDIAAALSINVDGGLHKANASIAARRTPPPPPPNGIPLTFPTPPKPLTELFHPAYQDHDDYPKGVADMVGYWAECRLFGGVVLFDRGESGTECKDVYIHPTGRYRIFQLSESQIQQFVDFALSEPAPDHGASQGLRFRAEKYARRIDSYDAMSLHIYRDWYERRIPSIRPVHCVVRGDDDPDYAEALEDFVRRSENCGSESTYNGSSA